VLLGVGEGPGVIVANAGVLGQLGARATNGTWAEDVALSLGRAAKRPESPPAISAPKP
jgi:hypothetical protein